MIVHMKMLRKWRSKHHFIVLRFCRADVCSLNLLFVWLSCCAEISVHFPLGIPVRSPRRPNNQQRMTFSAAGCTNFCFLPFALTNLVSAVLGCFFLMINTWLIGTIRLVLLQEHYSLSLSGLIGNLLNFCIDLVLWALYLWTVWLS